MIEIRGKKNTALCFASQIDEKALEQIKRMCDYDLTLGSDSYHAGCSCRKRLYDWYDNDY